MGNQSSSCSHLSASSSCSSRLHAAFTPSATAKVLLLDGQVLHFTKSVKAIHLLLKHPHHCLCPAQSLRLMHSDAAAGAPPEPPSSLLPDDELQLGRIYILLPFHTFRLFVSAAAASKIDHTTMVNRDLNLSHALPLYAQSHHGAAPAQLDFSGSRRSSPWTIAEEPTSIYEEPTSNQAKPTSIHEEPTSHQAKSTSIQGQPTSINEAQTSADQGKPTVLSQVLFHKTPPSWINEEEPTSKRAQPNSVLREKPILNQTPTQYHPRVVSCKRNPSWISGEEATNINQQKRPISALLASNQTEEVTPNSSYRTFIVEPSVNTILSRATLSGLPAPAVARRSFERQRPHKGLISIRRCKSWRPRLQAITEMSTW